MKIKLLLLVFLVATFSYGQYKESTPWMKNLRKDETSSSARSQKKQYSIYEMRNAFDEYWKDSGKNPNVKGSGYKQFKRWENFWSNLVDERGMLPTPKELWDSYINKERGLGNTNPTSNWSPLGPTRPGVLSGSLPGTGRINTVLVDPNDENIWYAGAPAGGIWKSTDSGANWVNLFDDFPQIGVSGIAIDASNSNIVYIATGDDDAGDSFSAGVFKSLDGGLTWNETGLNPDNSNVGLLMNEIFINPNDTNIVFVGTTQGLFRTTDGGDNWESILSGSIDDFRLKPNNPDTIYAIANNDQYFKSTDGGSTFSRITDILPNNAGRSVIEVTEANPDVLYIMMAETFANGGGFLGLFKSSDSGETFEASPNTVNIFEANQTFFNLALEVSPFDENLLFTGALNVWSSVNGGVSFNQLSTWFINNERYTHADIHFIRYFNDTLFLGTDGGLYISNDDGGTFEDMTGDMEVTQFYRIDIAENDPGRIAGGTQDNSGFVLNNGEWNVYTGGDGMDYEIDPNNPDLIYGFVQFGRVMFITTDAGETIAQVNQPVDENNNDIDGNWITPLTIASDGTVYSGFDNVYRLEGNQWVQVSTNFVGNIEDLEAHPTNPDILFAAENNLIFRSTDRGQTFIALNRFDSQISSFDINPNDPNIVYVTTSDRVGIPQFAQQNQRGVFKITIDGNTATEEDITLNLPTDQAFFSIAAQGRHTDNPIFVGTNLGIYRLDDTLSEWEEYFTGLPTSPVGDMEISSNSGLLIASTYGRGVWQSPIPIQVPDNDIQLISITPESSIFCGEILPAIELENNGSNPITEINVSFALNNESPTEFTENVNLAPNERITIQLPGINIETIGPNELLVTTSVPNDQFDDNNSATKLFFSNDFGIGDDVNDFESSEDQLLTFNSIDNDNSLWELGSPSGDLLNEAASGSQVYGTNLDGNYPDNTTSFLVSNCYELSNILAPVLRFNMAFDLETNFDIVFVQYSLDEGNTWEVLGSVDSQPNWYNSNRTNASSGGANDCQNCPGAQWTGSNAAITEYSYDFIQNAANGERDLTNEDNVIFRVVFQSDTSINQEGAIIDDFVVEGFQDDDDDDNDGILDTEDNCPLIGNASQLDTDGDGMGDACDDDDDGDGILDTEDNCPLTPNSDQSDIDNDGIGDVCDMDEDNDGVPNDLDLCPDTPLDSVVDVDGCPVFTLPSNNFSVLTTGESCVNSENGSVNITATESLDYSYTLNGVSDSSISFTGDFNIEAEIPNLSAGEYNLCITVATQPDYQACFDITIVEPELLSAFTSINSLKSEVAIQLSGGVNYSITLNGEVFSTQDENITLPLNKVENSLEIRTDRDCQGIFSQTILLTDNVVIYPNPIDNGLLTVVVGEEFDSIPIALFNSNGAEIVRKTQAVDNGKITINVDGLAVGLYHLNLQIGEELSNYKILKR